MTDKQWKRAGPQSFATMVLASVGFFIFGPVSLGAGWIFAIIGVAAFALFASWFCIDQGWIK